MNKVKKMQSVEYYEAYLNMRQSIKKHKAITKSILKSRNSTDYMVKIYMNHF